MTVNMADHRVNASIRMCGGMVALAFVLLDASVVVAQPEAQWNQCVNADRLKDDPDLRVGACGALLQSGRFAGRDLGLIFWGRGLAYYDADEAFAATENLTRALEYISDAEQRADLLVDRGTAFYKLKDLDRSFEDWARAKQLDEHAYSPMFPEALMDRGDRSMSQRQYARAIADYTSAMDRDAYYRSDADATLKRARAYRLARQLDLAAADVETVFEIDPPPIKALLERGLIRLSQRLYASAVSDLDRVLAAEPRNVRAMYARGVARQTLAQLSGDDRLYQAAEDDISEANRLDIDLTAEMSIYEGIMHAQFRPPGLPATQPSNDTYSGSPVLSPPKISSEGSAEPTRPASALDMRALGLLAALAAVGFAVAVWRRRRRA